MAETKEVHHSTNQPLKVVLQKTKGGYSWDIHATGANIGEVQAMLREADRMLRSEYKAVK